MLLMFLSPAGYLYLMGLPILKHAAIALAVAALIPLQWRLGGTIKATVPFNLVVVTALHLSIAGMLGLYLYGPWVRSETAVLLIWPLVGLALPLWLALFGVTLITGVLSRTGAAGNSAPRILSSGRIGGFLLLAAVVTAEVSIIFRSAAPYPGDNLAVAQALQAVGGATWIGAGAALAMGSYCLSHTTSIYLPMVLEPAGVLLAVSGSLTAGSGFYVLLVVLVTAHTPQAGSDVVYYAPVALANHLWITGTYALIAAALSLLCFGFALARLPLARSDPQRSRLFWASGLTGAGGVAIFLVVVLDMASFGIVAGIVLLLWLLAVGAALATRRLQPPTFFPATFDTQEDTATQPSQ